MNRHQTIGLHAAGVGILFLLASPAASAFADADKAEGLIKARTGSKLVLQTPDAPNLVVLLTDETEVGQSKGVFKLRRKEMSMTYLVPGLKVQVEGAYDADHNLVAKSVKFNSDDLKRAQAIQAGLHETAAQTQQNKQDIAKNQADITANQANIATNQANIAKSQEDLKKQQEQYAANKAAIDAAVARFGQLDDYYIFDEVTVYFANGKSNLDAKYQPQLLQLAEKARAIQGYMIEIKGFASAVGNADLNQKLSEDRADNVMNFLLQKGKVPLTNMLAPGAMGESDQVGSNKTAEGQAQNRRVVVRVLQNKGVAGT